MLNLVLVFVLVLKPKALYCLDAWNKLVFHSLPVIASLDTIKLVLVVLFFFSVPFCLLHRILFSGTEVTEDTF